MINFCKSINKYNYSLPRRRVETDQRQKTYLQHNTIRYIRLTLDNFIYKTG